MKKIILLLLLSTSAYAQVGIGTSNPSSSSILDINTVAGDKGLLIPRINIEDLTSPAPITGLIEESLLVYNTNIASGKGFHYWDGTLWQPFNSSQVITEDPGSDLFWKTSGNLGTNAGTNMDQHFLGTWDNQDLIIATNTQERIRVKAAGNIGIGEPNPAQLLHLTTTSNGQGIRIQRGTNSTEITQNTSNLNFNSSNTNGTFSYSFAGSDKLVMDNNQLYPSVNSLDNINNTGYDLGVFNYHFRRVYSQAIHTNDNGIDGGLRINIGSTGGSNADYMFSDFALFPVLNAVKDLGRNGNSWNNLYYQNAFRTSDSRKKKNITALKVGLETINSLNTYQYNYVNDKNSRVQYGFIAQELLDQIPSIVDEGLDLQKSLAVDYGQLIPILVKAVQEQQIQINDLKDEIIALQN